MKPSLGNKLLKYCSLIITALFILFICSVIISSPSINVFTEVQGGQITEDGIAVPIIMYHSILKNSKELGKYVITPDELESDLKYLKEHNYNAITMTDLINYVYDGGDIPLKPIVITFDDGNLNNYLYGQPLLQKYRMRAVISVVGSYSEKFSVPPYPTKDPYYSFASWNQIKNMQDSGYFEIQNHTYNLHNMSKRDGAKRRIGESIEDYRKALLEDVGRLQQKLTEVTGVTPNTFTYPFGAISKESREILKEMGFKATLTCAEGVNLVSKNKKDTLFGLKRYNRPHGITSEKFFKKICP